MNNPAISVIMPVFNSEKYLRYAIESILNQTFPDFEFIIINDGSTDNTSEIINSYYDNRIVKITNEENAGLIASLNKGIKIARGKYIARFDGDDFSEVSRLQEQYALLERDNSIGVCSSDFRIIYGEKEGGIIHCLPDNDSIRCAMFFYCPIAHPTVMFRSELLNQFPFSYDPAFIAAEDYELWWRLSAITKFANINKPLVKYRLHESQVSESNKESQNSSSDKVRERILELFHIKFTADQLKLHHQFGRNNNFETLDDMLATEKWLKYILQENQNKKFLPEETLHNIISARWLQLISNSKLGIKSSIKFLSSGLTWRKVNSLNKILKTAVKCSAIR